MTGRQKRTIRRKALRKMAGLMPGAVKKGAGAAAVLASQLAPQGREPRGFERFKSAPYGALALFGCLIYLKNRIIPKYADDYPYSFIWDRRYGNLTEGGQEYRRVRSVRDLVQSQKAHYKTWDGRVLADFMVQLFLMSDEKKPFDMANTLVTLSQLMVCYSLGKGKPGRIRDMTAEEAAVLTAGFWSCMPNLIATCFWLTGSVTYQWTGLVQSLFVLPYGLHYHDRTFSLPAPAAALMGLLAGWSVETGAGAALMLSGMELLRSLKEKESAPWMVSGVLRCIAGMALLLAAPGNRVKFRLEQEMSDTLPKNLEEREPGYLPVEYLYTPVMFRTWLLEGFRPAILRLLPLQVPVAAYFAGKGKRSAETDRYLLGLEAAALAVPSVMMLSPEYPARSTYPSGLYALAACVKALDALELPRYRLWSPRAKKLSLLAGGALLANVLASLAVDADLHEQIKDQIRTLREKEEKGEQDGYVENVGVSPVLSAIAGDRSVTLDLLMGIGFQREEDPYNRASAAYYGFRRVICGPYGVHPYYGKDRKSVLMSVLRPIRSLGRVTGALLKGERWPGSSAEKNAGKIKQ